MYEEKLAEMMETQFNQLQPIIAVTVMQVTDKP